MRFLAPFLWLMVLGLSACTQTGRYPISGQPCSPGDPVLQMGGCNLTMLNFHPIAGGCKPDLPCRLNFRQ